MSLDACAALVSKGDPDRFRAAMCAPMPVRGDLMALYAFNLEVARAPYASEEPMIAEMRVQWWADAVEEICAGKPPRAHEVVQPLAQVVRRAGLAQEDLEALVEARRGDARREAPVLDAYLEATGGGVMALAAQVLGGEGDVLAAARDIGWASGAANYLAALPELAGRGQKIAVVPEEVARLARDGLARLRAAHGAAPGGAIPKDVVPAVLPGWDAERMLMRAVDDPELVADGRLRSGEMFGRLAFGWAALKGRV